MFVCGNGWPSSWDIDSTSTRTSTDADRHDSSTPSTCRTFSCRSGGARTRRTRLAVEGDLASFEVQLVAEDLREQVQDHVRRPVVVEVVQLDGVERVVGVRRLSDEGLGPARSAIEARQHRTQVVDLQHRVTPLGLRRGRRGGADERRCGEEGDELHSVELQVPGSPMESVSSSARATRCSAIALSLRSSARSRAENTRRTSRGEASARAERTPLPPIVR